jgi:hypothetical protein
MNKLDVISIVVVCTMLTGANSQADVVVYKESCGHYAFEDWNLTCKIDKNTFNNKGTEDFWAERLSDLQSITICASFHNRGKLNSPATIVHNYKDGEQSMPVERFDTVKFQGSLLVEKMSWLGTSPRFGAPAWRMRGELIHNSRQDSFIYTETLLNGQRPVGEIRATCSYLEDK